LRCLLAAADQTAAAQIFGIAGTNGAAAIMAVRTASMIFASITAAGTYLVSRAGRAAARVIRRMIGGFQAGMAPKAISVLFATRVVSVIFVQTKNQRALAAVNAADAVFPGAAASKDSAAFSVKQDLACLEKIDY